MNPHTSFMSNMMRNSQSLGVAMSDLSSLSASGSEGVSGDLDLTLSTIAMMAKTIAQTPTSNPCRKPHIKSSYMGHSRHMT